jgi:cytochrome c peroxidase
MSSEKIRVIILFAFFAALVAFAVTYSPTSALSRPADQRSSVLPIGKLLQIKVPLGLPPLPVPADNPPTAETVALGRRLYYDPALSADNTISCASCHSPQAGFTDRNKLSLGVGQKKGTRHSPTVINSAYCAFQFWDGRAPTLEEQAKGPIANPVEMASNHADVVKRVQANPQYVALFKQAWGTDQITIDLVVKSIASFERTVLSGNSPFEPFLLRAR